MSAEHEHIPLLPLGEELAIKKRWNDDSTALAGVITASVITAFVLIFSYGSVPTALALIGAVVVIVVTFYRIDWGFYLFIAAVLFLDQTPPQGFGSSVIGVEYFLNLKSFPMLASVEAAVVTPMEIHLLLIFFVWILLIATGKNIVLNRVPVWFGALLFFIWIGIALTYGLRSGGDFLSALWELRALFYLCIMYFFVPQMIQTREQLQTLIWVFICAFSFKGLQGIIRFVGLGFSMGDRTELTNHEDPLFFVSLFIFLAALSLFGSNVKQRRVLAWLAFPLFIVFVLAQRRATYGALGIALVALMVLLPKKQQARIVKIMLPAIAVFGIYIAIFWNSTSSIALPAQLVKSSFSSDKETAGERYTSNLYREIENYNLAQTLKKSPVFGIGFGNKYDQPLELVSIPFPLRDYIPHNEIYWMVVKSGAVGFFFFWLFFDVFILQAAFSFYRLTDPYLKSVCAVLIVAVMGQIIVSYFDLQLTYYRNMVYLGTVMGLLPTLQMLDGPKEPTRSIVTKN